MPPIEPLEARTLLAGNVIAKVVNDHLYLFGDAANNAVEIRGELLDAKSLMIIPGDDTTTINGLTEPAFFSGFGGHVIVRLGGGADRLHVANADLPKDLRVELEAGSDLFTSNQTMIHRNLLVRGGAGIDRILPSSLRVLRAAEIHGDADYDQILLAGCRFGQAVSIFGGDGDDLIDTFQSTFSGGTRIDGGDGNDVVNSGEAVNLRSDFNRGRRGWGSGFADWRRNDRDLHEFIGEPRALPAELGVNGQGYLLSGDNRTDDLFMFITTAIQVAEAGPIIDGPSYLVEFEIVFASNAVTGGFGVGGSAGDSVYLKAGASSEAPSTTLDEEGIYRLNLDMGQQASGGSDISVVSTIANGLTPDQVPDPENPPYRSVRKVHVHPTPVSPGTGGKIHLSVGIDSGFEATTAVYIQRINVRLVPINIPTG